MKFTPDPGTLFYARSNLVHIKEHTVDGTVVLEKTRDRSWAEHIFRCVAVDESRVVADTAYGHIYGDGRKVFARYDYEFLPVSGEVAYSLGVVP